MERKWWQEAVVYQIYPRSFMDSNGDGIGDLPGILERLDYLQWLGVDTLWLCPIFVSPDADNGYDVADYLAIAPRFGTMADFDQLLDAVHRRGMRLILDLVPNHTSDRHPWFIQSRSSRTDARRDWYIWRDGRNGGPPNNWESIFGGPAWTLDAATGQYYLHLFTPSQPDLNWENPHVREAIAQVARWWLDKGVDGFRIDAVTHIKKAPGLPDMPNPAHRPWVAAYSLHMNVPGVLDHLDALCQGAFRGRELLTVGEANGVEARSAQAWVGWRHQRLAMILHFEYWHLWSRSPGAPLDVRALKRILGRWQKALAGRGWNALYLENTELPRVVSRWGDPVGYPRESATALATACFLLQGTPFLYQGQELGLANPRFENLAQFRDLCATSRVAEQRAAGLDDAAILTELRLTSRDNARTPMPWNDDPFGGFTAGTPWLWAEPADPAANVAREQTDEGSPLHYFRRLLALRRAEPALRDGAFEPVFTRSQRLFAYFRVTANDGVAVICNLTGAPARCRSRKLSFTFDKLLLANRIVRPHPPLRDLALAPYEARVYRVR